MFIYASLSVFFFNNPVWVRSLLFTEGYFFSLFNDTNDPKMLALGRKVPICSPRNVPSKEHFQSPKSCLCHSTD